MVKEHVQWDRINSYIDTLYQQIIDSGETYDKIVGIMRGGAIPAVMLSHKMKIRAYMVGIKTYDDDKQTNDIEIYGLDPVFYVNCENKRILIVDDICDSGQSISILKRLFNRMTTIPPKFATIHLKPGAQEVPDFYACETSNYIVYPWETI